jgi:hypothetical protein
MKPSPLSACLGVLALSFLIGCDNPAGPQPKQDPKDPVVNPPSLDSAFAAIRAPKPGKAGPFCPLEKDRTWLYAVSDSSTYTYSDNLIRMTVTEAAVENNGIRYSVAYRDSTFNMHFQGGGFPPQMKVYSQTYFEEASGASITPSQGTPYLDAFFTTTWVDSGLTVEREIGGAKVREYTKPIDVRESAVYAAGMGLLSHERLAAPGALGAHTIRVKLLEFNGHAFTDAP